MKEGGELFTYYNNSNYEKKFVTCKLSLFYDFIIFTKSEEIMCIM